jgi:hypothetical protein
MQLQPILASVIRIAAIASINIAGLILTAPAKAQNPPPAGEGIQFNEQTVVEFEFRESHGFFQSTFGVVNLNTGETIDLFRETKPFDDFTDAAELNRPSRGTNDIGTQRDFIGTPGNSVLDPIKRFTFQPNTPYAFYLQVIDPRSGQVKTTLYSTKFVQTANGSTPGTSQTVGSLADGEVGDRKGVRISWDDTGLPQPGKDQDFDDFVVEAGGYDLIGFTCTRILPNNR